MMHKFEMTNLDMLHCFLGLEVNQSARGITITQKKYAWDLLQKFNLGECKEVATPMNISEKLQQHDGTSEANSRRYQSMVGGLIYLTHTSPDLAFAAGVMSQFMHKPTKQNLGVVKQILRYVAGTMSYGLHYKKLKISSWWDSLIVTWEDHSMICEAPLAMSSCWDRVQSPGVNKKGHHGSLNY